jgi:hypothetical protein
VGRQDPVSAPAKESELECCLEIADEPADGRLRDAQEFCRSCHTTDLHDSMKRIYLARIQRHRVFVSHFLMP